MNTYNFKPLVTDDIVPMCKIIKKIGIENIKTELKKLDFKPITNNENKQKQQIDFAIDIAGGILSIVTSSMDKVHNELKQLLSDKTGLSLEEISSLEFDEYLNLMFEFFKQKEFVSFFTVVSKSLGLTI